MSRRYERGARKVPSSWLVEERVSQMLPIHNKDGVMTSRQVSTYERRQMGLRRKQQEKKEQEQKRKREEEEVEEDVEDQPVSSAETQQEKVSRIAAVSTSVLSEPNDNIGELASLLAYCVDLDSVIQQLSLLSAASVFADLMPQYRIREADGTEGKQSKQVHARRKFERVYLHHYKHFLSLCKAVLSLSGANPPTADQLEHPSEIHVKSKKALGHMKKISLKCLGQVFLKNPQFNYAPSIVSVVIPSMINKLLSEEAIAIVSTLFREAHDHLEAQLQCVQLITQMIKSKGYLVDPKVLGTFLNLKFGEEVGQVDIKSDRERGRKKKDRQFLTRKKKKIRKEEKEFIKELDEFEGKRKKVEVNRFHTQMLQSIFATYFRVLKNHRSSWLLPAVLEGVARFSTFINIDFLYDIVQTLLELLRQDVLPVHSALHCCVTAFTALKRSEDAFDIDLSEYFRFLYPVVHRLPAVDDYRVYDVAIDCLQLMLKSPKYRIAARTGAFLKRMASVAIHLPVHACLAVMQLIHQVADSDHRFTQFFDPEEGNVGGYDWETPDPELSNPFATSFFELSLLQKSFHPHISILAEQMAESESPTHHMPAEFLRVYHMGTELFVPELKEPPVHPVEKKRRKIAGLPYKKKISRMATLIPRRHAQPPSKYSFGPLKFDAFRE